MVNEFAVSGFVAVEATVNKFETASVARFPLSIGRTEQVNGQDVKKSALVNVEAWRKNDNTGEFEYMKKGNLITIEGYFKPEEWQDKEGKKHERIVFNATRVYPTPDKE